MSLSVLLTNLSVLLTHNDTVRSLRLNPGAASDGGGVLDHLQRAHKSTLRTLDLSRIMLADRGGTRFFESLTPNPNPNPNPSPNPNPNLNPNPNPNPKAGWTSLRLAPAAWLEEARLAPDGQEAQHEQEGHQLARLPLHTLHVHTLDGALHSLHVHSSRLRPPPPSTWWWRWYCAPPLPIPSDACPLHCPCNGWARTLDPGPWTGPHRSRRGVNRPQVL